MEEFEQKSEKQLKWQEALAHLDKIGKVYGIEMDPGIKEAVAALNLNGFVTYASCEGHLDKGSHFPLVSICSKFQEGLFNNQRYVELANDNAKEIDDGKQVLTDEEKKEYRTLLGQMRQENDKEKERLLALLEEFYAAEGESEVRLSVRPPTMWLMPEKEILDPVEMPDEREKEEQDRLLPILKSYQREMDRFAAFLKKRFFAQ